MSESTDDAATHASVTEDWLGYGAYADALWARVIKALNKDSLSGKPLGDDPLVVGLFGEWGAGKSHLLKLMYERAQAQSARDVAERVFAEPSDRRFTVTVPVMFQPWKYEHEEHLHVPIAAHVRDALNDAWEKLPTDFEHVKKLAGKLAETAEETEKKISRGKTLFEKFQNGVAAVRRVADSDAVGFVAATLDAVALCVGAPPVVSTMRKALIKSDEEADAAADAGEASDPTAGKDKPDSKATETSKRPTQAELDAITFGHRSDGFGFYRVDKLLRALTRPTRNKKVLATAGMKIGKEIEFDLGINFVVFVDDLDRCLPEKAVQMLELIKTVFNVESFAFVLALDDEVIERGIGHRYKEYKLQDKKPEMPITGFEYLEKIVHVPFRLPALTRYQAERFIQRYEAESIEADANQRWFTETPSTTSGKSPTDINEADEGASVSQRHVVRSDVLDLALSGFDVYMPRKLVRLTELVHQISDVARRRGKPIYFDTGGAIDVRVVLTVALVQLFQPELYRMLRRRPDSFPFLLAAFSDRPTPAIEGKPRILNFDEPDLREAHLSSIDLWRWAVRPKLDKSKVWEPTSSESAYQYAVNFIAKEHADDSTERANAQLVRLPLVVQLLEHRAAQRHVFDVLKLVKALAMQMTATNSNPHLLNFAPYLTLLAMEPVNFARTAITLGPVTAGIGESASAGLEAPPRITSVDVQKIADDLWSSETAAQANLASRNSLKAGRVLSDRLATQLVETLHLHLEALRGADDEVTPAHLAAQRHLLTGLQFLAPFLAPVDRRAHWDLVKDCVDFDKPIEPKLRALWGDVRSALGCDDRFDPKNFYLLKDRFAGHDETVEPIPGFVRVSFKNFRRDEPFYLSRTLVTVDQFALFVDANEHGYGHPDFWDISGQLWRKAHPTDERIQAMNLPEQRRFGSRPIVNVTWFEARAFARWLTEQIRPQLLARIQLKGYRVALPIEAQWQRAATASDLARSDDRTWPWGNNDDDFDQRANVGERVGGPSSVGLYAPNPMGSHDMAGNAWEWMDNDFKSKQQGELVPRLRSSVEALSLRGGSWIDPPGRAACSYRVRNPPDNWNFNLGFRVVLSLAKNET